MAVNGGLLLKHITPDGNATGEGIDAANGILEMNEGAACPFRFDDVRGCNLFFVKKQQMKTARTRTGSLLVDVEFALIQSPRKWRGHASATAIVSCAEITAFRAKHLAKADLKCYYINGK